MSEQASFVQDGMDRFNEVYRSLDESFQKLQKQLDNRRRSLEKQVSRRRKSLERQLTSSRRSFERQMNTNRKSLERRTRKQVSQLRKNPVVKRAAELRADTTRQIEDGVDTLLGFFNIASKSDVAKIDKKLRQISRKLRDIETKRKANGAAARA